MSDISGFTFRRDFGLVRVLAVAATLAGMSGSAGATNASEGVIVTGTAYQIDGVTYTPYSETADFSSSGSSPTDVGALTLGSNLISGATIPDGPVQPSRGLLHEDDDYLSFTIPDGAVLTAITLAAPSADTVFPPAAGRAPIPDGTIISPGDLLFVGLASGNAVNVTQPSSAGLIGFALASSDTIGSDILPSLGSLSAPPPFNAPPFLGATGFSGPLGAGTYSLWLVDGDRPVAYKLDLEVASVPEPATWASLISGFGLIGGALRRRSSASVSAA